MSFLEGSLVLEKLVVIGKLDEFYEAVDSDNFARAKTLMKQAGVDQDLITEVIKEMTLAGES